MPLKQATLKSQTGKTKPEVLVIQGEVHAALFLDSKFILPAKAAVASFQLQVQLLNA